MYNDEFSARLSVNSILRLRAAAIAALSDDSSADSAIISKLTRRTVQLRKCQECVENQNSPTSATQAGPRVGEDGNHVHKRTMKYAITGGVFLCGQAVSCMVNTSVHCATSQVMDGNNTSEPGGHSEKGPHFVHPDQELHHGKAAFDGAGTTFTNENHNGYNNSDFLKDGLHESSGSKPTLIESSNDMSPFKGQTSSAFVNDAPTPIEVSIAEAPEVFLAGFIIHIVPEERNNSTCWTSWVGDGRGQGYKAFLAHRECFKDIVISPFMFLDHLPWR